MTLEISLHHAERSKLSTYISNDGDQCLTIYAKEFQGHRDEIDVWFPSALAAEIHAVIQQHYEVKKQAEDLEAVI